MEWHRRAVMRVTLMTTTWFGLALPATALITFSACRPHPSVEADAAVLPRRPSLRGGAAAPAAAMWPATLPATNLAADRLIASQARRSAGARRWTIEQVVASLRRPDQRWHGGWPAIRRAVARTLGASSHRSVLLWGVYHDAGAQIAALRRLLEPGPSAIRIGTLVVEQFDADGSWREISSTVQQGDDRWISRFVDSSDALAFGRLMRAQHDKNYTAWKYGYLSEIADLLVWSRATATPLYGCDMAPQLRTRISHLGESQIDRLRELHCWWHLQQGRRRAERLGPVVMLWGQSHVWPEGVVQFVPPEQRVLAVSVFGGRAGTSSQTSSLGRRLWVNQPVLVPLPLSASGFHQAVLFLDKPPFSGEIDRAQEPLDGTMIARGRGRLVVRTVAAGRLLLGKRGLRVGQLKRSQLVAVGPLPYRLVQPKMIVIGSVFVPERSEVQLTIDSKRRLTEVVYRRPASALRQE